MIRRASTSGRQASGCQEPCNEIHSSTSARALARVMADSAARKCRSQPKPSRPAAHSSDGGSISKIERRSQTTADATRATEIYSGRFAFAGKVVVCDRRSIFEMEPPSDEWAAGLLGFGWLRHLRAAESGITRANARALVDEWITLESRNDNVAWR